MPALEESPCHVGLGLYTLPDAARIVGAPVANVRRWANDVVLVRRTLERSERLLTFAELMELHFIKMFRDEGVSLQTIRRASTTAAKRFDASHPFSVQRFDTDGKTIFATLKKSTKSEALIEDLEKSQYVFGNVMRPFFRKLEYSATQAIARYWPRTKRGRVVLDPARNFGAPIDAATGVPTRVIVDALSAGRGQSPQQVARWLDIPLAAVEAAVAFEQSLAA